MCGSVRDHLHFQSVIRDAGGRGGEHDHDRERGHRDPRLWRAEVDGNGIHRLGIVRLFPGERPAALALDAARRSCCVVDYGNAAGYDRMRFKQQRPDESGDGIDCGYRAIGRTDAYDHHQLDGAITRGEERVPSFGTNQGWD